MIFAALSLALIIGVYLGNNLELRWRANTSQEPSALTNPAPAASVQNNKQSTSIDESLPLTKTSSAANSMLPHVLGEETIANIAAQAAPSVVNVELSGIFLAGRYGQSNPKVTPFGSNKDDSRARPENSGKPVNPVVPPVISGKNFHSLSSGSGLIIRKDGYIVTNNHLIRPGCKIKVTLSDQRAFEAKLVGRDAFADLAVLKIDANQLPVVPFANSKLQAVRPGDWAIVIGNPLGYDHTVTLGIVSAIHRSLKDLNAHVELIQTDAAINPGNSGGPLLNIRGQIIGLASAIRNDAQNIGFAIPVSVVEQVSNSLIEGGAIDRPYLGIFMKDFDNRVILDPKLPPNTKGVLVESIMTPGPAEQSGVCTGDLIETFAGVHVSNAQEIRNITQKHKPGDVVALSIIHEGKSVVKKLTIGIYPTEQNILFQREQQQWQNKK